MHGFRKSMEAYAKVNLHLQICGQRDDGYHLLYTFMQTISLSDTVELEVFDSMMTTQNQQNVLLIQDQADHGDNSDNTACRAAEQYLSLIGNPKVPVRITLTKRIPVQAGLGGGSADAAATLNLMNEAFAGALNEEQLLDVAKSIGADVPFFLRGGTALCEGIGEIITPVSLLDGLPLLLIQPLDGISTPEAYAEYDRIHSGRHAKKESQEALYAALCCSKGASSTDRIRHAIPYMVNDLEPIALEKISELRLIFSFLETHDAIFVRMSGSGSAVFGVFANTMTRDAAWKAAEKYSRRGLFVCPCETIGIANSGS